MDFLNPGLHYGQIVVMHLLVNNELVQVERLVYKGRLTSESDWLHFVNTKTKENHLVKDYQYPGSKFKMGRENQCEIIYND